MAHLSWRSYKEKCLFKYHLLKDIIQIQVLLFPGLLLELQYRQPLLWCDSYLNIGHVLLKLGNFKTEREMIRIYMYITTEMSHGFQLTQELGVLSLEIINGPKFNPQDFK